MTEKKMVWVSHSSENYKLVFETHGCQQLPKCHEIAWQRNKLTLKFTFHSATQACACTRNESNNSIHLAYHVSNDNIKTDARDFKTNWVNWSNHPMTFSLRYSMQFQNTNNYLYMNKGDAMWKLQNYQLMLP